MYCDTNQCRINLCNVINHQITQHYSTLQNPPRCFVTNSRLRRRANQHSYARCFLVSERAPNTIEPLDHLLELCVCSCVLCNGLPRTNKRSVAVAVARLVANANGAGNAVEPASQDARLFRVVNIPTQTELLVNAGPSGHESDRFGEFANGLVAVSYCPQSLLLAEQRRPSSRLKVPACLRGRIATAACAHTKSIFEACAMLRSSRCGGATAQTERLNPHVLPSYSSVTSTQHGAASWIMTQLAARAMSVVWRAS